MLFMSFMVDLYLSCFSAAELFVFFEPFVVKAL